MISSIINKETLTFYKQMNILFSRTEDKKLIDYIKKIDQNINIDNFENTLFGFSEPNLLICNNRILDLEKSINLCKFFHIPMLIVDTEIKPQIVSNKIDNLFGFYPVIQIAASNEVYYSWNKCHDFIIPLDAAAKDSWKNLMYSVCKEKFLIGSMIKNDNKKTI
jgi:hypothetical protein